MAPLTILENVSLQNLHTFHFDVKTRYYTEIQDIDQLAQLFGSGFLREKPFLILGGGSNLLFTSDYDGIVVRITNKGIATISHDGSKVVTKAAAGENWHQFVLWCVKNGFGGLENLSLIPGNVGSSPIQNIGAYGVEIKDTFFELEAFDLQSGAFRTFSKSDCRFGYRESVFKHQYKGRFVIWNVSFELSTQPVVQTGYGAIGQQLAKMGVLNPTIADVSEAVCQIRSSKLPDPDVLGNAGSFFKNPVVSAAKAQALKMQFPEMPYYEQNTAEVKLAAGWLIERCGWKGVRHGDAGVHATQALVLVNHGHADGNDILDLAREIQNSVKEKFGVKLEMEVNIA